MDTISLDTKWVSRIILIILILLIVCSSTTVSAENKPYTLEFPKTGTYSLWVQDAEGKLTVLPYTIYEKKKEEISRTINTGSVVNVMDDSEGTVARCVITGDNDKDIHLTSADFGELPLKADEKTKINANAQSFYILPPHLRHYDTLREVEPWAAVTSFVLGIIICSIFVWAVHRIGRRRMQPVMESVQIPFVDQNITLRSNLERNEFARLSMPTSIQEPRTKTSRRKRHKPGPFITGTQGMVTGTVFKIHSPIMTIGRDGENDIVVAENTVSRKHAELITNSSGAVCLKDFNSANGVYVNGERIQQAYLSNGDEIKIGDNFFTFTG